MNPRQRALVVVLADDLTDTQTAMVRNGMHMLRGVARVVPVDGMPDDDTAQTAIRRDVMGEGFAELRLVRQQRDELASRLRTVQEAATGGIPLAGPDEGEGATW